MVSAMMVKPSLAGDPCASDMTDERWSKFDNCGKKFMPDYKAIHDKWAGCFGQAYSVAADRVPTKLAEVKAIACSDVNKGNKGKFDQCFYTGPIPDFSNDMKVS
ncbi:hypothetical protein HDE_12255 [Halotydeus destructor]|nr:hypothetical protein HDE_12255 [Halotydeus destructor]